MNKERTKVTRVVRDNGFTNDSVYNDFITYIDQRSRSGGLSVEVAEDTLNSDEYKDVGFSFEGKPGTGTAILHLFDKNAVNNITNQLGSLSLTNNSSIPSSLIPVASIPTISIKNWNEPIFIFNPSIPSNVVSGFDHTAVGGFFSFLNKNKKKNKSKRIAESTSEEDDDNNDDPDELPIFAYPCITHRKQFMCFKKLTNDDVKSIFVGIYKPHSIEDLKGSPGRYSILCRIVLIEAIQKECNLRSQTGINSTVLERGIMPVLEDTTEYLCSQSSIEDTDENIDEDEEDNEEEDNMNESENSSEDENGW